MQPAPRNGDSDLMFEGILFIFAALSLHSLIRTNLYNHVGFFQVVSSAEKKLFDFDGRAKMREAFFPLFATTCHFLITADVHCGLLVWLKGING